MIPPQALAAIGVCVLLAVTHGYAYVTGSKHKDTEWTAKVQTQRADAEAAARKQEANWQGAINAITTQQDQKLRATQRNLAIALDSLQSRPLRPYAGSQAPRTDCPCSTGAGLCKQDAEFLTREASRADDHRTGLAACYEVIDKVK
jgi:hypothetical protein